MTKQLLLMAIPTSLSPRGHLRGDVFLAIMNSDRTRCPVDCDQDVISQECVLSKSVEQVEVMSDPSDLYSVCYWFVFGCFNYRISTLISVELLVTVDTVPIVVSTRGAASAFDPTLAAASCRLWCRACTRTW